MRRLDPLTPDEARELDALERALAGDPVDPDLRELEQLVHDLRATAPEMTPAFAARLERDVADGFPDAAPRPKLRRPRRWVLPAVGVLAAALIALVVVLGQNGNDAATFTSLADGSSPTVTAAAPEAAADSAGGAAASKAAPAAPATVTANGSAGSARTPAPAAAVPAPAQPQALQRSDAPRKVQRSADLTITTPSAKFETTSDAVIRTVDRFGGIVAASSIGRQGAHGEASFDLRIPTGRLDDALAALSKLGHVSERTQDLQDITSSFTSVQDRLTEARAERKGLLAALAKATTQGQIDSLKARLRTVRATLGRLGAERASLQRRADLSRVSLTLRGVKGKSGGATTPGAGDHWTPGDAAHDALRVLEVMAGVALIALAIAVPLGLLGLAIALGARSLRRRERERALDPA
ncbi:MAG TPA: DUF4349 domain-containing protein [Solirubrobacteraceae bacterium]|nr:DUF4349 domain-containing protein [Solirubrobacteraceae bacterium]